MRLWPGIALAVVLTAAGWFGYRGAHRAGYEAGAAAVKAEWSADRQRAAEAATQSMADALKRRDEVERGLEERLDAADRRGRDLARRLRDSAANTVPSGACPATGSIDEPARESGNQEEIGSALGDHLAACERDAARLDELQRWLKD